MIVARIRECFQRRLGEEGSKIIFNPRTRSRRGGAARLLGEREAAVVSMREGAAAEALYVCWKEN